MCLANFKNNGISTNSLNSIINLLLLSVGEYTIPLEGLYIIHLSDAKLFTALLVVSLSIPEICEAVKTDNLSGIVFSNSNLLLPHCLLKVS